MKEEGEGGQRREEKVLKSARESEQFVNFVVEVWHFSSGDIAEKEERCD